MAPRVVAVLSLLIALLAAPAARAADARTAPPASPEIVAACGARAAEQRATAHVERLVRGVGTLGGCVADAAGIAHMFLEWSSEDRRERGRICVDPRVRAGAWSCSWDTTALAPGPYVVTMVAVDVAGNRASVDQAYRVERAAREQLAPAPRAEPSPAPMPDPTPDPRPAPAHEPAPAPILEPEPEPEPADPIDVTPVVPAPLAQLIDDRLVECARLELAPGVVADRALSLAVLDCMRPALDAAGASTLRLDEIPVPPSIRVAFADPATLAAAAELLPATIGGVSLELVLDPPAPESGQGVTS